MSEKLGFSEKNLWKSKTLVNFFKFDPQNMNYQKSKNIQRPFFFNVGGDAFGFLIIDWTAVQLVFNPFSQLVPQLELTLSCS